MPNPVAHRPIARSPDRVDECEVEEQLGWGSVPVAVTFVPKDRTSSRPAHEMSLTIRQAMVDGLQQQDSTIERGRRRPDRALPPSE